ncbi:hypothetical protein WJX81_003794 [Elliptochloris bilobata]|uniref:Uncharacterized protein n=1 Tax=Elliptochloris bilobata TaxID=381761 RepID=A0AAW1RDJ4_9CHLO
MDPPGPVNPVLEQVARLLRSLARASGADADRLLAQFTSGSGIGALAAGLQECLAAGAEPAGALVWDPRRTGTQQGSPASAGGLAAAVLLLMRLVQQRDAWRRAGRTERDAAAAACVALLGVALEGRVRDFQLRDFGPLLGVLLAVAACDVQATSVAIEAGLARRLAGVLTVEPWEEDGGPYRAAAAALAAKLVAGSKALAAKAPPATAAAQEPAPLTPGLESQPSTQRPPLRYRDAAVLARGLRGALDRFSEPEGERVLSEEGAADALRALRSLADAHASIAQDMVDSDFAIQCDRIADKVQQAETRALADGLLEKMAELATAYRADLVD